MLKKSSIFFRPGVLGVEERREALEHALRLVQTTLLWGLFPDSERNRVTPIQGRALENYYDIFSTEGRGHMEVFKESQRVEFTILAANDPSMVEFEIKYFKRGQRERLAELETIIDPWGKFRGSSSCGM